MADHRVEISASYEAPELKVLGTVHDLTLTNKNYGESDGFQFLSISICNISVCPP